MVNKKYKGENYKRAHEFFKLKKGDGLVLHHKDINLINSDIERYNQWRIEDLIVLSRKEHAALHRKGKKDSQETKEKRASKLRGKQKGHWYKNEDLQISLFVGLNEIPPYGYIRGRIISKEAIDKMAQSKRGKPSWNKGKTLSEEHKKNLSKALKGKSAWNKGTHGLMNIWNKGKTGVYSEETRQKISESLKGNCNRKKENINE